MYPTKKKIKWRRTWLLLFIWWSSFNLFLDVDGLIIPGGQSPWFQQSCFLCGISRSSASFLTSMTIQITLWPFSLVSRSLIVKKWFRSRIFFAFSISLIGLRVRDFCCSSFFFCCFQNMVVFFFCLCFHHQKCLCVMYSFFFSFFY